jgi:predicted nuclease with TOPRIM domain
MLRGEFTTISCNVKTEGTRTAMAKDLRTDHPAALSAQSLAEQLAVLQRTLDEKRDLLNRNQQLHLEIIRLKEEISRQEVEIQSLSRDLSELRSSREQEMEEVQGQWQERYNQEREETANQLAAELKTNPQGHTGSR